MIPSVTLLNSGEVFVFRSSRRVCGCVVGICSYRMNQDHEHERVQLDWCVEVEDSACEVCHENVWGTNVGVKAHVFPWYLCISSTCHQFGGVIVTHSHVNLNADCGYLRRRTRSYSFLIVPFICQSLADAQAYDRFSTNRYSMNICWQDKCANVVVFLV